MSETGVVNIRGKEYKTVAKRIDDFRGDHPDYSITTKILSAAELVQIKATIRDQDNRILATGLAEEERGSTNINRTSALENAETSAVGRALSFLGYGGTEIASAEEVVNAINNQDLKQEQDRMAVHMQAVRDNWESVEAIQTGIASGDLPLAAEAWFELPDDAKGDLWRATTKGGIFTTQERAVISSTEFRQAHYGSEEVA